MDRQQAVRPEQVCVVTVTYGNRWHLLRQLVDSVKVLGVARLIVVDNLSDAESQIEQEAICERSNGLVQIVRLPRNVGSAGGYKAGIEAAMRTKAAYFWLLDDDNVPEEDALQELLHYYIDGSRESVLLSLRADRAPYVDLLSGRTAEECFGQKNSFFRFSWRQFWRKPLEGILRLNGASREPRPAPRTASRLEVPRAPYGGLLLPRAAVAACGLPNEAYFVDQDDFEYSQRIVESGFRIVLIGNSRVRDVDVSWTGEAGGVWTRLSPYVVLEESSFKMKRIYYSARNAVHNGYHLSKHGKTEFSLNVGLYALLLGVLSSMAAIATARSAPLEGYRMFLRGVYDGYRGALGPRFDA